MGNTRPCFDRQACWDIGLWLMLCCSEMIVRTIDTT